MRRFWFRSPASPLGSSAFGRTCVGLRPKKLLVTREKIPLVARVIVLQNGNGFLVDTVVRYCENKNSSEFPSNEFFLFPKLFSFRQHQPQDTFG